MVYFIEKNCCFIAFKILTVAFALLLNNLHPPGCFFCSLPGKYRLNQVSICTTPLNNWFKTAHLLELKNNW